MLSVRNLSKTYPNRVLGLHPTSFTLEQGERLALIGPSGSGKSTLLRLIAGLEDCTGGEIWLGSERIDHLLAHQRGAALLPQRVALYPHLTVRENLEASQPSGKTRPPIPDLEDRLALTDLLNRKPEQLSGGEQQRVALAKMLRLNRPIWLLDEPFSCLDPMFRSEFRDDLHLLLGSTQATIILVTHDPDDALAFGQRIGVLAEGKLQQIGPADFIQSQPSNRFVAFCTGRFAFLDGSVEQVNRVGNNPSALGTIDFVAESDSVRVPIPPEIQAVLGTSLGPTSRLTLGLRPDDVVLRSPQCSPDSSNGTLLGWPLVSAEPDGSGWLLTVARGRTRLRVRWSSGSPPPVGTLTEWIIPAGRGTWFDGNSGKRLEPSPSGPRPGVSEGQPE
jgi:multiple sugar transport system ATP-binding protein